MGDSEECAAGQHANQTIKNYTRKNKRYFKSKDHCMNRVTASGCRKTGVIMLRRVVCWLSPLLECRLGAEEW